MHSLWLELSILLSWKLIVYNGVQHAVMVRGPLVVYLAAYMVSYM